MDFCLGGFGKFSSFEIDMELFILIDTIKSFRKYTNVYPMWLDIFGKLYDVEMIERRRESKWNKSLKVRDNIFIPLKNYHQRKLHH